MKKIMFNDTFGLTNAVLARKKTMTRRFTKTFKVGEIVAIAQSYFDLNRHGFLVQEWSEYSCGLSAGYLNKMFVRADLMPFGIQITDLKEERLQDISDEDCIREGICEDYEGAQYSFPDGAFYYTYPFNSSRAAFAALIDKVCGKGTWKSNPIVYAYSFKLIVL